MRGAHHSSTSVASNESGVLLRCVDPLALDWPDGDGDSVTVLKDAQLFEALGLFERRDRPGNELTKECRAVDVEPDVAKGRRAGQPAAGAISMERDWGAGEIQRAATFAEHDLDEIWVVYGFIFRERGRNGRDIRPRRRKQEFNRRVDDFGLHFRFIALNVDEHVSGDDRRHFRKSRGAVWMVDARQDCVSASCLNDFDNPSIVGGNDDFIEASRLAGCLEHVHDKGLACLTGENLFRKARGGEASGDDADGAWSHELLQREFAVGSAR